MEQLQVFNFNNNEVRTQISNNEVWFCLKDVCDILELTQPSKVKARLNKKGVNSIPTLTKGGNQSLIYINESNLYKVIFQSRKEEAERFTEYVTGTILPTIRKHGAYMTEQTLEQALTNPDFLIKLATELKEEKEKRKELEVENQTMKPKVLFADAVSASQDSILIGQLAKLISQNGYKIGQNRLFAWMRENGFLCSKGENYNMPTQKSMNMKLMEIKERTVNNPDGSVRITKTTKVTGKGQIYFVNKFNETLS